MPENTLFTRMNTNYDRLSVNFARSIAIRKLLYYIFEGKWFNDKYDTLQNKYKSK